MLFTRNNLVNEFLFFPAIAYSRNLHHFGNANVPDYFEPVG